MGRGGGGVASVHLTRNGGLTNNTKISLARTHENERKTRLGGRYSTGPETREGGHNAWQCVHPNVILVHFRVHRNIFLVHFRVHPNVFLVHFRVH